MAMATSAVPPPPFPGQDVKRLRDSTILRVDDGAAAALVLIPYGQGGPHLTCWVFLKHLPPGIGFAGSDDNTVEKSAKERGIIKRDSQDRGVDSDLSSGKDDRGDDHVSSLSSCRSRDERNNSAVEDTDRYTDVSTASVRVSSEDRFLLCSECSGSAEESTGSAGEFDHAYQASDDTPDHQLTPTSEIDCKVDGDTMADAVTAYSERGVEEYKHAEGAPPVAVGGGGGTRTYQIDGRGYGQHDPGKQEEDPPLDSHCAGTMERLLARGGVFDDDRLPHLYTVAQAIRSELKEAETNRSPAHDAADVSVNSFPGDDGARLTCSDQKRSSANLHRGDERGDHGEQDALGTRSDRGQCDDHDHCDDDDLSSDGVGMMYISDNSSSESTPSHPPPRPRRVISEPVRTASPTACPVSASTTDRARDTVSYPVPDNDHTMPSGQSALACPTSRTPSLTEPLVLPRIDVPGVGVRVSDASTRRGEGASGGAGWGVFCANPVKRGEAVFEEEALLIVSRYNVEIAEWEVVLDAAEKASAQAGLGHPRLEAMELMQAVAWDQVNPSVQERVQQLSAPEVSAIPSSQLKAWRVALEFLRQRGFLGDSSSAGEGSVGKGGRNCDIDSDRTEEQVAELLRVLMICEANIFGTEEDEEEAVVEEAAGAAAVDSAEVKHKRLQVQPPHGDRLAVSASTI